MSEDLELERLARMMSQAELEMPRRSGGHVVRWAQQHGVSEWPVIWQVVEEFRPVAARELDRRETAARAAGVLRDGRWPIPFDLELRAA